MSSPPEDDQIDAMPYRELQKECRKAGLSAAGKTAALRKRLRGLSKPTEESSAPPAAKRQKKNEDDLICPISLSLPFDPVTAEDGRVYERGSIEEYFKGKSVRELRSPITKEKMGKKLLPAIQHKNSIETLIENGAITGELAEDWKAKAKKKEKMKDLLKKAEDGDEDAMESVATGYNQGIDGFKEDHKKAYGWYQKAHAAGSVYGMAKEGEYLLDGLGGTKDQKKGMMYLGMAEGRGSNFAAYLLGMFWFEGAHGLPVDKVLARQLLEKSLSNECTLNDLSVTGKQNVQQMLNELANAS